MSGKTTQHSADSSDDAVKTSTTLQVEIFGSAYGVRSDRDPEHLLGLAAFVDEKMREIAGKTVAVETSRIAILAALNIADELAREREQKAASVEPVAKKANTLLDQLEDVLTDSGE